MFAKTLTLAAATGLALLMTAAPQAQDAMSSDAMAPMMSDDELAQCLEQAKAITFPDVAMVAEQACHNLHNGHDAMGGDAMMGHDDMGGDAMGGDNMGHDEMGGDAMGGDAMAPKQ